VITGATESIVPADRKLYELRDVTGTVPSIPLITSSIMSKKLAESLDALVLDVKYGSGAFMATREQAEKLAASLIGTGRNMGVATEAVLSDMNQPLGEMVGNACEVNEAMAVLRGKGPSEVADLVVELCSHLLLMTKSVASLGDAKKVLWEKLTGGFAFEKFMKMVSAQGGKLTDAGLETASPVAVEAFHSGRIVAIDGQRLGEAVIQLGGGRRFKGEKIDHSVGLKMHARIDDQVLEGETLLEILAPVDRANTVVPFLQHAFTIV
jgi:pyrimidine-nucleoside phosphorylase